METTPTTKQFTTLFDNKVLSQVERMRLNPTRRLTNRSRGEHVSGKGGSSTDFADYRNYVAGDDVRNVDWNIFSRLHKPYLKLFSHEEEMHIVLIVDASSSMMFEGKFERARQLAAALGVMGLMNMEKVSAYSCNHMGTQPACMAPCTGRTSMKRLFDFLENIEAGGDFPIERAVNAVLARHRGRGIVVLLSDFLTLGELHQPLNLLFRSGLEIFAMQILSPVELNPEVTGDLRFVDSETGASLDVSSVGELLGIYHEHRQALADELSLMCRQRAGRFLSLNSADPLEAVLFDELRRRGWVI